MNRLLPARPALARWRRHVEILPHGLPTAITFTVSVAAFLFGSLLVVGGTLPQGSRSDADEAFVTPGDPTPAGPSTRPASQTPGAAAEPTPVVSLVQVRTASAATRAAAGNGRSATNDGGHDRVTRHDAGSGSPAGSDGLARSGSTGGRGDGPASTREPRSEPEHHAPAPSSTPTPERHRGTPEPAPTSTPEPEPE